MAKFQKGQSGNPAGRPPSERTMAKLIEQMLSQTIDFEGKRQARKRVVATLVARIASEGKIIMPDGRLYEFSGYQWFNAVLKILEHLDGPARAAHDLTLNGNLLIWDLDVQEDPDQDQSTESQS